jgi:hypothetical protein
VVAATKIAEGYYPTIAIAEAEGPRRDKRVSGEARGRKGQSAVVGEAKRARVVRGGRWRSVVDGSAWSERDSPCRAGPS